MNEEMKSESWRDPWEKLWKLGGGPPTKHPGSKVPLKVRVSRRRAAAKRAKATRRQNRG